VPPRTPKSNVLISCLAVALFLISGIVIAAPRQTAEQKHWLVTPPSEPYVVGLQLQSPTGGVDFGSYMRTVYASIKHNFLANIPESPASWDKGVVVVRFRIPKDGKLADDSVTIVSSSGKKDMDAAALNAIRTAAPFERVPEAYVGSNLDLLAVFSYNRPPRGSGHLVPIEE
jgi:TonB family protein